MPFPREDPYWMQICSFLERHAKPLDAIMAPNNFLEIFPGAYHYNVSYLLPIAHFAFVVFHKGMVAEIERPFALAILRRFQPVFANEVFVVYAKEPPAYLRLEDQTHVESLQRQVFDAPSEMLSDSPLEALHDQEEPAKENCAIIITTYNRPKSLERSLPQLVALGVPIVVVDDASLPEHFSANQQITDRYQVPLLPLSTNRGLPCAINVGISYWLADPDITWISYFQDDVDVRPELLSVLAQIQDARDRPLLTGRDAPEHPTFGTDNIAGHRVLYKRSMPGVHLHAHRDYWIAVMPIPTPYLGAPKPDKGKPGQGADEDWWITAWSPKSITKRGGYGVCVPGLVRTFYQEGEASTWANAPATDPNLTT